jgi:hypothetical protein
VDRAHHTRVFNRDDATSVYWVEEAASGVVKKVPLGGGTPTILAAGVQYGFSVAADSTSVYWLEDGGGLLKKARK